MNRGTCVPQGTVSVIFLQGYGSRVKESSIDMHRLWILCGRPRHGTLNNTRLNAKLLYKNAVKRAALDFEQQNADEIGNYLLHKDSIQFCKCWNSRYQKSLSNAVSVAGHSDSDSIADSFKNYFSNTFINSSDDTAAYNEFKNVESKFNLDGESSLPYIDVECIERCIKLLKPNKAAGHDGISTEHILNSHPALVLHLKVLFEMFLKHSYVPNALGIGIIIPIIKDKHGDFSSVDNYRPITLSPII